MNLIHNWQELSRCIRSFDTGFGLLMQNDTDDKGWTMWQCTNQRPTELVSIRHASHRRIGVSKKYVPYSGFLLETCYSRRRYRRSAAAEGRSRGIAPRGDAHSLGGFCGLQMVWNNIRVCKDRSEHVRTISSYNMCSKWHNALIFSNLVPCLVGDKAAGEQAQGDDENM